MHKLGKKQLSLQQAEPHAAKPENNEAYALDLSADGHTLTYTYDSQQARTGITALMRDLQTAGVRFRDLQTKQSSLEEIFVSLVHQGDRRRAPGSTATPS